MHLKFLLLLKNSTAQVESFFETHPDKVETFLKAIHEAIHNAKEYIEEVHSSPMVGGLSQIFIQTKVF